MPGRNWSYPPNSAAPGDRSSTAPSTNSPRHRDQRSLTDLPHRAELGFGLPEAEGYALAGSGFRVDEVVLVGIGGGGPGRDAELREDFACSVSRGTKARCGDRDFDPRRQQAGANERGRS